MARRRDAPCRSAEVAPAPQAARRGVCLSGRRAAARPRPPPSASRCVCTADVGLSTAKRAHTRTPPVIPPERFARFLRQPGRSRAICLVPFSSQLSPPRTYSTHAPRRAVRRRPSAVRPGPPSGSARAHFYHRDIVTAHVHAYIYGPTAHATDPGVRVRVPASGDGCRARS